MFKNKDTALAVKEAIQNINLLLLRSYSKVLQGHEDLSEVEIYKKKVSQIQKSIFEEILEPIIQTHPDLQDKNYYSVDAIEKTAVSETD